MEASPPLLVRYTKFTIDGMPGEKHAVLIPDDVPLTRELFEDMCAAIGKEPPSMLVRGVGTLCHPSSMATPQLRASPAFARLQADSSKGTDGSIARLLGKAFTDDKGAVNQISEEAANRIMDRRVAGMVSSVASAAEKSNSWIFTGPLVSNFEVLLQQTKALQETKVFCCVAAHLQDSGYMSNSDLARQMMQYIFTSSCEMSEESVKAFQPIQLTGNLWDPAKNTSNKEFGEHGFDYWSFKDEKDANLRGHPLASWAWPWADLFLFFYHDDGQSNVDWNYKTPRMWDLGSFHLDVDDLAPTGLVFLGGQAASKKLAMQAMKAGRQLVFVDNTPSMPKQMSTVLGVIDKVMSGDTSFVYRFISDKEKGELPARPTSAQLLQALSASRIMKYVEKQFDASEMETGARLDLSDVMTIIDLAKQKPRLFRQRTCTIDPLTQSPDDVLPRLSSVLCAATAEGAARSDPLMRRLAVQGWQKHSVLVRIASHYRQMAVTLDVFTSLLTVLGTLVAVTAIFLRFRFDEVHEEVLRGSMTDAEVKELVRQVPFTRIQMFLHFWMMVLPVAVAILMAVQHVFKFSQKWATVHVAAAKVASDIHLFLGSAGEQYSEGGKVACDRFVKRLKEITTDLTAGGIREEDLGDDFNSSEFGTSPSTLSDHVMVHVYGVEEDGCLMKIAKKLMCIDGAPTLQIDGEALLQLLDSEAYIELRVAPLMVAYHRSIADITSLRDRLQITTVSLFAFSAILVVISSTVWTPALVTLASALGALMRWVAPLEAIVAMTEALAALKHVDAQWASSSASEQRAQHIQEFLMSVTEEITQAVAASQCQLPVLPEVEYEKDLEIIIAEASERMGSRAGSRAGSRMGSRAGSRTGSRAGSRGGSRAASRPGSRSGSRFVSRSASRVASRAPSPPRSPKGGRKTPGSPVETIN